VAVSHVRRIRKVGKIMCVEIYSVECQGVFMPVGDGAFIGRMAYGCYGD